MARMVIKRFFAAYGENGKLLGIGTGYGGVEITEAEYNTLLSEIRAKADLVNKVYSGEITIADVKPEWQEEIQRRVDQRIAWEAEIAATEETNIPMEPVEEEAE